MALDSWSVMCTFSITNSNSSATFSFVNPFLARYVAVNEVRGAFSEISSLSGISCVGLASSGAGLAGLSVCGPHVVRVKSLALGATWKMGRKS